MHSPASETLRYESSEKKALFYQMKTVAVAARLATDMEKGLSHKEVAVRLKQFGKNELEIQSDRSLWRVFLDQFLNPLVWVLAIATLLAFAFQEYIEGLAILIVLIINALIGFGMEWQAMRSMDALRRWAKLNTRVIREGQLLSVPYENLVPGDLIFLEAGDMVPADCRLVQAVNLSMNEGILTGESASVKKQTAPIKEVVPLADQRNMLFKSTGLARGNARALVVTTGMNTAFGQIVQLSSEAKSEATPLEQKLNVLSQRLLWLTLIIAIVIVLVGLLQGRPLFLMIETAIALAIAAIPEGLPIVATIALAKGMLRLARHNAVVKKLSAVETLGETQIILTDKTGTLTENKMMPDTLVFEFDKGQVSFVQNSLQWNDQDSAYLGNTFAFRQLQKVAILCNNASFNHTDEAASTGDPMEVALLKLALANDTNISTEQIRSAYPRLREIPFESQTKMMGTLHQNGQGKNYLVCIKGALEVLLKESDFVLTKDGQKILEDKTIWLDKANQLAAMGARVLAFAYSEIAEPNEDFFKHLIFIGIVGFLDPPRAGVKEAIETCHQAGIKVLMLTGDHPETARHIALETGLTDITHATVMHGKDINTNASFSEAETNKLLNTTIFARVSPQQKLTLVQLFQSQNLIVGMTGDGVNDTPALKKADIGIAMGQRGTEAAKEAADLVLEDDAFSTIVLAIQQGREIFQNIRHFVIYLLSCNLSELLVVFIAFLANAPSPLLPLQILFINMITDVYPALALGLNKGATQVMRRKPRSKDASIINPTIWKIIIGYALSITIATIAAFMFALFYLDVGADMANNFSFYTLTLAQLWHVFNLPKAPASFFNNEVVRNKFIWLALALCLLILTISYSLPIMQELLNLQMLTADQLAWILLFSLLPVVIVQLTKRIQKQFH